MGFTGIIGVLLISVFIVDKRKAQVWVPGENYINIIENIIERDNILQLFFAKEKHHKSNFSIQLTLFLVRTTGLVASKTSVIAQASGASAACRGTRSVQTMHCIVTSPVANQRYEKTNRIVSVRFCLLWCGQQDLNLHSLATIRTWILRVCQFRHVRTTDKIIS